MAVSIYGVTGVAMATMEKFRLLLYCRCKQLYVQNSYRCYNSNTRRIDYGEEYFEEGGGFKFIVVFCTAFEFDFTLRSSQPHLSHPLL